MLEIIALVDIVIMLYFLVRYIVAFIRKKPHKLYLMAFIASVVVLSMCTAFIPPKGQPDVPAANAQATEQPWKRIGSPFSIAYPPDWAENAFAPVGMKMVGVKEGPSVYLATSMAPGEGVGIAQTDEELLKMQVDASLHCEDTRIERLEHVTISGAEAVKAVYVTADDDKPEEKTLTYYAIVRDGSDGVDAQVFLLDCPLELRAQYEPVFQRMIDSIE